MRGVPGWALLSAGAAPVLLIGGWTLGAARQPGGFDPVTGTISALAAVGATDRWIMTLGLVGLGLCHLVTAAGLRPLRPAGRWLLAVGGVSTVAVAALPLPADGDSTPHGIAAALAFGALALWPALAAPHPVTPFSGAAATSGTAGRVPGGDPTHLGRATAAVLLLLVGWFVVELASGGPRIGLTERVAAGAEALAPLLAVLALRRRPA